MKFAGKKSIVLKSETFKEFQCPNCNIENTTKVSVIGVYKHLLYIPFLNGGKNGESKCEKCDKLFQLHAMPNSIKLAYFELKETVKTPIWFYSGLIGIKTLVLIKIFSKYI